MPNPAHAMNIAWGINGNGGRDGIYISTSSFLYFSFWSPSWGQKISEISSSIPCLVFLVSFLPLFQLLPHTLSLSFLFCAGQIPDMNAFSLFLSSFSSIPMKWVRLGSQVGTTLHIFLNFLLVYLYWVRGWVERYGVLQRYISRWFYLTTAQLIILRGQLDAKILNIILV